MACGRCGKNICVSPGCIIQTPVGARCRECARVTPHPTFNVTPSYYIKAAVAGGIVAIVSGIIWGVLVTLHLPFVPWLAAMGAGYAIGEAVGLASNRKRGQGLATLAGVCAGVATLTMFLASSASVFTLVLGALIAVYSAVYRVR